MAQRRRRRPGSDAPARTGTGLRQRTVENIGHGSSEFRFQLHFSEEVDLSATDFTGALFITAGGTVISATPLQPPSTVGWEVVARPDSTDDMVITLPEGRGCDTDGAVCAPDGSWLASTITTTIAGPAGVP